MSFDDQVDLGIKDNSGEKDDGFEKFLSKPIQRQYQPFGGPKPQKDFAIYRPSEDPNHPDYYGNQPVDTSPLPFPGSQPQPYQNFNDYDLDVYEQKKKQYTYVNQDASAHTSSAKLSDDRYDDFVKTKFRPYYQSLGVLTETLKPMTITLTRSRTCTKATSLSVKAKMVSLVNPMKN
jgi:hypothetical protein